MYTTFRYCLLAPILAAAAHAQTTLRASVDSVGTQGDRDSSYVSISAGGRYVAFSSEATNLVPGDTNGFSDVFVRDFRTGETTRVSVSSTGAQGNSDSWDTSISGDGRYVAFESRATNLVPTATGFYFKVFVHDRVSGQTIHVSVGSTGAADDGSVHNPTISADGRYVAFASDATNLVPGDTNGRRDVFVRDLLTSQTKRVSVGPLGVQGNGTSDTPSISADGRFVAFESMATILLPDTNPQFDIFVYDQVTYGMALVSVDSSGVQGYGQSVAPSISADGGLIAFISDAPDLVSGDTNAVADVFVHDRLSGETTRVSVDSFGGQANSNSDGVSISADGRYAGFTTWATNLVPGDTNGTRDVLLRDLQAGQTTWVSVDSTGAVGNGYSFGPAISASGRYVAFNSNSTNLVPGDTNGSGDVFLHDRQGIHPFASFCFGDGSLATACPCAPPDVVPNPSGAPGHGCANSFEPAGGLLAATGSAVPDTVVFVADIAPNYVGFAYLVRGDAQDAAGIANGDGVRCVDGALIRFGGHNAGTNGAAVGHWTYPNPVQTTPVSVATGQGAGQQASYQLLYRNAAAGFCSPATANWTNGVSVAWP